MSASEFVFSRVATSCNTHARNICKTMSLDNQPAFLINFLPQIEHRMFSRERRLRHLLGVSDRASYQPLRLPWTVIRYCSKREFAIVLSKKNRAQMRTRCQGFITCTCPSLRRPRTFPSATLINLINWPSLMMKPSSSSTLLFTSVFLSLVVSWAGTFVDRGMSGVGGRFTQTPFCRYGLKGAALVL